ncbi:IS481 family transposase, partial [Streptomyces lydicus]|uniref:IS481 family transposase n=1 Tax=Streptomyces lydicus TaxID=47763 RepID=UPI0037AFF483
DRVCTLRQTRKLGPARIGPVLGLPASTVHRILTRHGLHRLAWLDRPTGRPIRRYERSRPGELVHVDIKKLGNIPDGGGWRTVGRVAGAHNRQATTDQRKSCKPVIGYSYIHSAVDDHSRLAYSEVLTDERKETAAAFWQRAHTFFTRHGITVERVLTDNGSCYKSKLFTQTLTAAGIAHKRIRPYRPQTNGKVERFNRTLLDEWAYLRPYTSNDERTAALDTFLHNYNHHRCHTSLGGKPPISRVNNPAGQYT